MTAAGDSVRSYRPGDWFGIVGERAVVILPPTEKPRVAALWELVDGGAGFDVTLDALISGGLRDLPAFVLVSSDEGETRVVIRGSARAEFVVGGETVELAGTGATTWVERSLSDVERMSVVLHDDPLADDAPAYVVDGGLFRIARLDEGPVHVGPDETAEEPAYEREFPLVDEPDEVDPLGIDTEPDVAEAEPDEEPVAELSVEDETVDEQVEAEPEPAPARSPEPPSWTPGPPGPPPPPPTAPPVVAPIVLPPVDPPTEAMPAPPAADPADAVDHDGLTVTGSWQPPSAGAPGIPGQPPAPDVTVPVARLLISNGESVDVDRAVVIGRAPEGRRYNDTEQPLLVTVESPRLEVSSTHLEVRPGSGADHGSAVVTDLGSTNGTVLVQPGLGPEDLTPGVPVQLIPGALIDLGDGVTIQVATP